MKEIDYMNAKMNKTDVLSPQFLYKYRPFDIFTYDMLDNGYVYLCPAEKLDDPSECSVDFSIQDLYDINTDQLKFKCVDKIMDFIKPHTSEDNFRQAKEIVARTLTPTGLVRRNYLLDVSFELQVLAPNIDIAPIINFLGNIPERLDVPEMKDTVNKLFSFAYDARHDMGICSLSELQDCAEMWQNYADNAKGYCVEYDMQDYEYESLLYPVVYSDFRETNIVMNILSTIIGEMIVGMSNGQILADKSQFIRMFLTKDLVWSYQKEWRLLGDANIRLTAPKINAIILGKKVSEQNKRKMTQWCEKHKITIRQN